MGNLLQSRPSRGWKILAKLSNVDTGRLNNNLLAYFKAIKIFNQDIYISAAEHVMLQGGTWFALGV